MAIRFGFYLSLLNFSRVVINQVGIWLKNHVLYYIAIVLYGINFLLALVWFVFVQIWRWSFTGRICSGDEFPREVRRAMRNTGQSTYLIAEGNLLEGLIIAIYSMFGLLMIGVLIAAIFFSKKKTEEELSARKGGLFKTDMAPSYEAKIARPTTEDIAQNN